MSSPVAIVKDMYAAFGRGDIDAVMVHLSDDVVWSSEGPPEMVFTGVRKGKRETLEGFFRGIAQEHAEPKLTMTEFVAEGDSVAAFGRYEATLKSGRRVDSPVGHLFKFRGGKVAHYTNLLNTAAFTGGMVNAPATAIAAYYTPAGMEAAQYGEIIRHLGEAGLMPPPGALVHACYGEPGQLRVLDIFDSLESFESFGKVLLPIIAKVGVDAGTPEVLPLHALGRR
jgi:ketosteroid isomerase-like protein